MHSMCVGSAGVLLSSIVIKFLTKVRCSYDSPNQAIDIFFKPHIVPPLHRHPLAIPTVHVTVHPRGLHPTEAARAWQLHMAEGMAIRDVCDEVVNMH